MTKSTEAQNTQFGIYWSSNVWVKGKKTAILKVFMLCEMSLLGNRKPKKWPVVLLQKLKAKEKWILWP